MFSFVFSCNIEQNLESSASSFVSSQRAAGAVTNLLLLHGILHDVAWYKICLAVGKGMGRRVDQRCEEKGGSTEKKWSCEMTTELQVTAFSLVDV